MTRQWDLEHHADAYPLLRDALAPRRPHGDALPRDGRRLARPRRPDRRAARVRARSRRGAASRTAARSRPMSSSSRSSRPRSSRASCSSRSASRARRPDVVPRGRAPRRRLRGRLRGAERRPRRRRRRRGDAGALGATASTRRRPVRPGRLQAGDSRRRWSRGDGVIEISVTVNGIAHERRGRAPAAALGLHPPRSRALRHPRRLRARRLRRMHGAARRAPGAVRA